MTEEEKQKKAKEQEGLEASKENKKDEYAENPEEVLSEEELEDLKKMEQENEEAQKDTRKRKEDLDPLESWDPITELGREVKDGKIKNIDEILDADRKIMEPEIVDSLLDSNMELLAIGQAKGKFGGGKRRAWKQTQKKTEEGNVLKFSAMAVVGDSDGHIGIGRGEATETLPARDKSIRKAKLNVFKIRRSCSAFDCNCSEKHTVPFNVKGKSGSVKVTLMPAPQGTGLAVADEMKKILSLAGIKDVYSKTFGKSETTMNLAKACIDALKKTTREANEEER